MTNKNTAGNLLYRYKLQEDKFLDGLDKDEEPLLVPRPVIKPDGSRVWVFDAIHSR